MINNKKELTIEELAKVYEETKNKADALGEQLKKAVQEEEDRKKAQLALEKDARKKEVDEAFDHYNTLLKAYINDYGAYTTVSCSNDFPKYYEDFVRSFF